MQEYYFNKIMRIEDEHLKVRQIQTVDQVMEIHLDFTQSYQTCPECGQKTCKVHDYRLRRIKHGIKSKFEIAQALGCGVTSIR